MNYDGLGNDGLCAHLGTEPFGTQSHSQNENLHFINIVFSDRFDESLSMLFAKKKSQAKYTISPEITI